MPIASKWAGTGFLSLLGVKTGGRLPAWPDAPLINPTIDLLTLIASDPNITENLLVSGLNLAGLALGSLAVANVPNGQTWGLLNASVFGGAIAANAQRVLLTMQPNSQSASLVLADSGVVTPSPGPSTSILAFNANPILWVPPGGAINISPQMNTVAVATGFTAQLRFVRCSM